MAAESISPANENLPSLSLVIPRGPSSVESSVAPSPTTGILSPSTSNTTSTSSLLATNAKANVTFAPLPELAPRKRRSAAPLGMAARTQLAGRGRRRYATVSMGGNGMWTEEEMERQRQIMIQESRRRQYRHHHVDEIDDEEDEEDDPFVAFGRVVKSAGRTIWKKVSQKDLAKHDPTEKKKEEAGRPVNGIKEVKAKAKVKATEAEVVSAVGIAIDPSTGIKDDDEEHFRTIGQTQTIREGSAEWLMEVLDEKTNNRPVTQLETHS